ncbi:ABC transporter permease [Fonticella tunisiensis]|uniref:Putative ABC transport system permease protein n=1 Tax=Fonticella tunisiensis TaxID=1096341 RepID=A0A4R7KPT4_9CLOT|nr:FtsX-like permease family protein [Fonticella tunisiensis]TDT57259.1 putative ABC transport system permease protein [Fonticella tunisiensis]
MLKRVVFKSIKNRKNRILVAVLAVVMGASMISILLNISLDLNGKMAKELRAFGANLVILPDENRETNWQLISMDEVNELNNSNISANIYGFAPYIYSVGKIKEQNVVIVGGNYENIKKISPWWKVEGSWNDDSSSESTIMIGAKVAAQLGYRIGDDVVLNIRKESYKKQTEVKDSNQTQVDATTSASQNANGDASKRWPLNILSGIDNGEYEPKKFRLVGIVSTGGSEDNQVFIKLNEAQKLFNRESQVNLIQVSVLTNKNPIDKVASQIEKQIPGTRARVLSQISKAEGNIQGKILFLMILVTILTLVGSGLSVMSTMTTTVLERRKEVGMMKAIGAENKKIAEIFYLEASAIGLAGGAIGYILGFLMAQVIGKSVFNTFISFHVTVIPITLIITVLLVLISSKIPVGQAIKIDPVVTLRGE